MKLLIIALIIQNSLMAQTFQECTGDSIIISAVGDILLHQKLQEKAADKKSFSYLFKSLQSYIKEADFSYANLEGTAAYNTPLIGKEASSASNVWNKATYNQEFKNGKILKDENDKPIRTKYGIYQREYSDGMNYSGFPYFNYHPSLINDLKKSGFDILSTANNHSLDRESIGIDRTIESIEKQKIHFVGTKKKNSKRKFVTRTQVQEFQLSWIACTEKLNGQDDKYEQVLNCHSNLEIKKLINEEKSLNRFVILLPHWGDEYNKKKDDHLNIRPNKNQTKLAKLWIDNGVDLIIGSHPHALQVQETYKGVPIFYSLGNFVSNQQAPAQRATGVLFLKLCKCDGVSYFNDFRFLPAYMGNLKSEGVKLYPLWESDFENQKIKEANFIKLVFNPNKLIYFGQNITSTFSQ